MSRSKGSFPLLNKVLVPSTFNKKEGKNIIKTNKKTGLMYMGKDPRMTPFAEACEAKFGKAVEAATKEVKRIWKLCDMDELQQFKDAMPKPVPRKKKDDDVGEGEDEDDGEGEHDEEGVDHKKKAKGHKKSGAKGEDEDDGVSIDTEDPDGLVPADEQDGKKKRKTMTGAEKSFAQEYTPATTNKFFTRIAETPNTTLVLRTEKNSVIPLENVQVVEAGQGLYELVIKTKGRNPGISAS